MISSAAYALVALAAPPALTGSAGGRADESPPELADIEVVESLGATVPFDITFTDEAGQPIRLGDLFEVGRPVLLTFNYSNCPLLCSVQLGGLVETLSDMRWTAGKQFQVVTIGLDPKQPPQRTAATKASYLQRYQRPEAERGWRFLTGSEANIRAVADAVGFRFAYYPQRDEYIHPAVLMVLSPSGVVSHYVYGVRYDATALSNALAAAALGDSTESASRFLLSCFHYEAPEGFGNGAQRLMRYAGIGFATLALAGLLYLFVAYRRRSSHVTS
jgi:protein SCO1